MRAVCHAATGSARGGRAGGAAQRVERGKLKVEIWKSGVRRSKSQARFSIECKWIAGSKVTTVACYRRRLSWPGKDGKASISAAQPLVCAVDLKPGTWRPQTWSETKERLCVCDGLLELRWDLWRWRRLRWPMLSSLWCGQNPTGPESLPAGGATAPSERKIKSPSKKEQATRLASI